MSRHIGGPQPEGRTSLSTRRGFVTVASLGAVSLYGLWAGLGAAPVRFWDLGGASMDMSGGGHGRADGASPDEFRNMAEQFNTRHRQADGSVAVEPASAKQSMSGMAMPGETGGPGEPMTGLEMPGTTDHSGHTMPGMTEPTAPQNKGMAPLDVYMVAQQWSFDPTVLRLKANQTYRFRMMAVDAAHGASLQLALASHIIRLPKGALVERELSFTRPGEYLLYCTMYCGEGHQFMSGKIVVS